MTTLTTYTAGSAIRELVLIRVPDETRYVLVDALAGVALSESDPRVVEDDLADEREARELADVYVARVAIRRCSRWQKPRTGTMAL